MRKPRKITGGPFLASASRMGSAAMNMTGKIANSAYTSTVNHFSDPEKRARCDQARHSGIRSYISLYC